MMTLQLLFYFDYCSEPVRGEEDADQFCGRISSLTGKKRFCYWFWILFLF